jgi:hypothetical protein
MGLNATFFRLGPEGGAAAPSVNEQLNGCTSCPTAVSSTEPTRVAEPVFSAAEGFALGGFLTGYTGRPAAVHVLLSGGAIATEHNRADFCDARSQHTGLVPNNVIGLAGQRRDSLGQPSKVIGKCDPSCGPCRGRRIEYVIDTRPASIAQLVG